MLFSCRELLLYPFSPKMEATMLAYSCWSLHVHCTDTKTLHSIKVIPHIMMYQKQTKNLPFSNEVNSDV